MTVDTNKISDVGSISIYVGNVSAADHSSNYLDENYLCHSGVPEGFINCSDDLTSG